MDETADTAIDVALGANTRIIDLIKVTVDDQGPGHFGVLAGVGIPP
jgi:diacylglycerol kinase family enzyme